MGLTIVRFLQIHAIDLANTLVSQLVKACLDGVLLLEAEGSGDSDVELVEVDMAVVVLVEFFENRV